MHLKDEYPLFRLFTSFPVSMIYALVTNVTDDTQVQLFILGKWRAHIAILSAAQHPGP